MRKSGGEKFHVLSYAQRQLTCGMLKSGKENERLRGKELVDIIEISSDEEDKDLYVNIIVRE